MSNSSSTDEPKQRYIEIELTRRTRTETSGQAGTETTISSYNTNSAYGAEQADQVRSTPALVWGNGQNGNSVLRDKTTINAVVTNAVFPKVKFADKLTQLSYSTERKSICQYVIKRCNLQPEVIEAEWWRLHQRYVGQIFSRLRNDRNTAMKGAVLGKCETFWYLYRSITGVIY